MTILALGYISVVAICAALGLWEARQPKERWTR
jgi:hypothetical protein